MSKVSLRRFHSACNCIIKQRSKNSKTLIFKLLISYLLIIAICAGGMGILSERFVTRSIINNTIKSNNELLNHLKNTIDSYVLGYMDKISIMILQDALENPDISFYFTNGIEGNLSGIMKASKYLDSLKIANPQVNNISIYYKKSELLISTEGVRYLSPEFKPDAELVRSINNLCTVRNPMWFSTNNPPLQINTNKLAKNEIFFIRKAPLVRSSAEDGGFIVISITEDILYNIIKTSSPVDFGQVLVIDEEGSVISHSNKEYLYSNIASQDYGKKVLNAVEKNTFFLTGINHVNSVISVASSDYNGWKYIAIKPIDKIKEKYRFLGNIILVITFLVFIFAMLLSLISVKKVYSPIKSLTNSCKEIIKKDSSVIRGNECEIIGSTLNILTDKVSEQENKITASFSALKRNFIMNLININTSDADEVRNRGELLKINFPFEYYFIILVDMGKLRADIEIKAGEAAKLQIVNYIESTFTSEDIKCLCTENNSDLVAVFNTCTDQSDINAIAEQTSIYIYNILKMQSYIGIGNVVYGVKNLLYSYMDARNCIKYSYLYPDNYIIKPSDMAKWELNNGRVPSQLLDQFFSSIRSQTKSSSITAMKKIINAIQDEHLSYSAAMKLISKMISFLDDFMEQMGINIFPASNDDISTYFDSTTNIRELDALFENIICKIFLSIEEKRSHRNSELVSNVKSLIVKNYSNSDISLNVIANELFISPNYLSKIFKEETGINFVDFLADYKLQKAQILVLTSNMKIEEISLKAGYSSPQYFIKKFKEKYSMTPLEYRHNHS